MTNTETVHLIRQAAHEIGITFDQAITIEPMVDKPGVYEATFKRRNGDDAKVEILMSAPFKSIHAQLKEAWKGK